MVLTRITSCLLFGCRRRRSSASRSSLRIRRKHLEGEAQPLCFHGNPPPHPPPSVFVNLLEDFFRLVISGDATHRRDVLSSTCSDAKSQPMHTLLHIRLFENFLFCFSIDSLRLQTQKKKSKRITSAVTTLIILSATGVSHLYTQTSLQPRIQDY